MIFDMLSIIVNTLLYLVNFVMYIALWFIFIYYIVISMFAWVKKAEPSPTMFSTKNRFAMLIAAHNEERVIGGAVRSLKNLNYPEDMYDIFVIADNCTDGTAKTAAENGAIVCERFDDQKRGKGFALAWMFEKVFASEKEYDAVCVLDADNLVSSNFLMEMNKQLCLGHKVIQGYLDSKNPQDSWITSNYAMGYWMSNRLFQLPRYYLGLSCALGGTGFVVATSVLKEIGWQATSLTEDLEFSVQLVLKGMKVAWACDAIIYDEKPLKLKQSWKQRKRWMQGHCSCAAKYLNALLTKAVKEKDIVSFDSALYLMQPFVIAINGVVVLANLAKVFLITDIAKLLTLDTLFFALLTFMGAYFSFIFMFLERKAVSKVIKGLLTFPIYNLTWIPIIIQGFINKDQNIWVHTLHTRALEISDVVETHSTPTPKL